MHRVMRKGRSQVHPRHREQRMPRSCGRRSTARTRGLAWGSECEERGGGAGGGLGKEVGSSLSRHHTPCERGGLHPESNRKSLEAFRLAGMGEKNMIRFAS